MKMPRSQPTHPTPEAEVVTPPQIMACGKRKAGQGSYAPRSSAVSLSHLEKAPGFK